MKNYESDERKLTRRDVGRGKDPHATTAIRTAKEITVTSNLVMVPRHGEANISGLDTGVG